MLSLFPGVGSLDEGFRRAGFCVVSAGDVAWGSLFDVRNFHAPPYAFDGVIAGDPCQAHSALANLVRAKGLEPVFPDLTPELERVILETRPRWFLRENVERAPNLEPEGYTVATFVLDHATMAAGDGTGHEHPRRRRFWFGVRGDHRVPELRAHLNFALWLRPADETRRALCGDRRSSFIPGGRTEMLALRRGETKAIDRSSKRPTLHSLSEMLEGQGLPANLFAHSPITVQGKRKLIGNAVPLPMAVSLGRAVRSVMQPGTAEVVASEPIAGGRRRVCQVCRNHSLQLNSDGVCAGCAESSGG